jgi:aminotransferase
MAGFRLGWVISTPSNIVDLQRYHMFISACESTPTQWAALAAIQGDQACVDEMVAAYRRRRDLVVDCVSRTPHMTGYKPGGAFFIMPSFPDGVDGFDLAMGLLTEARVCTIPGGTFGESCNNALRLSYATSEDQIEAAFERMIPWLSRQSF